MSSSSKVSSSKEQLSGQQIVTGEVKTRDDLGLPIPEPLAPQPPPSCLDAAESNHAPVVNGELTQNSLDSNEVISKLSSFDLVNNQFTGLGSKESEGNSTTLDLNGELLLYLTHHVFPPEIHNCNFFHLTNFDLIFQMRQKCFHFKGET